MAYKQSNGKWIQAPGKFVWSKKHRGIIIVGARGVWRLDIDISTDKRLVWKNTKHTTTDVEQIVYTRFNKPKILEVNN